MPWDAPPRQWGDVSRYAIAMAVGATWGFLWYGLSRLGLSVGWFWVVSVILFAPVLATLTRGILDLLGLLYVSFVASLLAALIPYHILLDALPRTGPAWIDLVTRAAVAWVPTWLAAGLLLMFLLRRPGGVST